ncbi:MAG TPA: Glu/Leu/Phe/Val dehydrogenase dimerization domain-containing protein, partial [Chitinophagales bacterium]|nr:Glu/Leu/Phe/Val dehydrogenase dimerization domain-containing protein [Chitinophagales bacterium]
MIDFIKGFEEKAPEIIFEWNDAQTDAQGWLVINSLRGGAAGGGTRMRKGLTKHEVISLAKTMEIKFSISGPSIGGAKSGIN